ncbi:winged helix-turn-helix transcriptional regulator [Actinoplanes lutulentus]|uniref:winged helix-turn-helix transcriptional regulator n=1 Tax=Actinoplanes lutulentus TaxID=1287878 RepID=UPI0024829CE4|nr:winged helix-turn-helix transcriptional regulator [Actinoplanes lutulentus]
MLAIGRRKLAILILRILRDGSMRYSRLQHAVSRASPDVVHPKTLTNTLNFLRDARLIERHQDRHGTDYRLTVGGAELTELIGELERWIREYRTGEDK